VRARLAKASDVVVLRVREQIVNQRLPEGTPLPSEAELMHLYGVGRVAVREALRLLERDGLIEVRRGAHGGIFVSHPEIRQVRDAVALLFAMQNTTLREFVEFRQLIEPAAAARAAKNLSEKHRSELARLLEGKEVLERVPDMHLLVAEATGNGVIAVSLNALQGAFEGHFRRGKIDVGHMEETSAAHRKIVSRILAGDGSGAERAMRVHLEAYRNYLENENLLDEPIIPGEAGSWRSRWE
jgi:GntR family transcriptional repressor for pyruvate dehydrogenase complex